MKRTQPDEASVTHKGRPEGTQPGDTGHRGAHGGPFPGWPSESVGRFGPHGSGAVSRHMRGDGICLE